MQILSALRVRCHRWKICPISLPRDSIGPATALTLAHENSRLHLAGPGFTRNPLTIYAAAHMIDLPPRAVIPFPINLRELFPRECSSRVLRNDADTSKSRIPAVIEQIDSDRGGLWSGILESHTGAEASCPDGVKSCKSKCEAPPEPPGESKADARLRYEIESPLGTPQWRLPQRREESRSPCKPDAIKSPPPVLGRAGEELSPGSAQVNRALRVTRFLKRFLIRATARKRPSHAEAQAETCQTKTPPLLTGSYQIAPVHP